MEPTTALDELQHGNETAGPPALPANNPASASSLRGQVGTVQTIQLRPSPTSASGQGHTNNGVTAGKTVGGSTLKLPSTKAPNVMPLLTSSEVCRQLHELRRQNEDLRRRVDSFQREKEEMLRRIDRLEQLVLIRDSEAEMEYADDL